MTTNANPRNWPRVPAREAASRWIDEHPEVFTETGQAKLRDEREKSTAARKAEPARIAAHKLRALREPMRETKELYVPNAAAVCHCGIDGHPLGSVNCPVHGAKIRRDAEEHYAKLAMERRTRALAAAMTSNQIAITADVLKTLEREITSYDLDEDADAYEAAAREEFGQRPSRPNAVCFDFDAIRYHLNVMRGDDINGTMYAKRGDVEDLRTGKRWGWYEREHDIATSTGHCRACLWSYEAILDGIAPPFCAGHPPKGEPCIQCGKPHVVMVRQTYKWNGAKMATALCVSCGSGFTYDERQPIPDRGAVRFEKRMKERAEHDYAKAWEGYPEVRTGRSGRIGGEPANPLGGLQAVEHYLKYCEKTLSPQDKAAVQAMIDSAHMGGTAVGAFIAVDVASGPDITIHDGRIAGPTRAERMALAERAAESEARNLHPAILKTLAAYEAALRAPRQAVDDAGAPIPPGEPHPEGCFCDVCIPF